jgi:hypothetical protein
MTKNRWVKILTNQSGLAYFRLSHLLVLYAYIFFATPLAISLPFCIFRICILQYLLTLIFCYLSTNLPLLPENISYWKKLRRTISAAIICRFPPLPHPPLCQMGRVWTSWPAKKGGRSVKGKKNSNADVCIYVCPCVSCSVVKLFTCTLVRSRPDSNKGDRCETRSVGTHSKILDEPWQTRNTFGEGDQKEAQSKPRARPCEVLQEDGCSSMYKS